MCALTLQACLSPWAHWRLSSLCQARCPKLGGVQVPREAPLSHSGLRLAPTGESTPTPTSALACKLGKKWR